MGAEIGNSTQKLHARGPIGLRELCTFKYLDRGRRARPRVSAASRLARSGILGGTFNPPHLGHLAIARHARDGARPRAGAADARAHPAAQGRASDDPGPLEHRLRDVRAAAADGAPAVAVCALEIERGGPSYTVDTLRSIHASHPDAELTFIVGADTASTLPTWREPQELLELATSPWPRATARTASRCWTRSPRFAGAGSAVGAAGALPRAAADRHLLLAACASGSPRASRSTTSSGRAVAATSPSTGSTGRPPGRRA